MKNRDIFSKAAYFVSSMAKSPSNTLATTWRGIVHGHSPSTLDKYFMPAFGALGAVFLATSVLTTDPVGGALGATNISAAAGHYLELGEEITPPLGETGPPAPPKP